MISSVFERCINLFRFQPDHLCGVAVDRFFTVLLCLLAVAFFFSYPHLAASKRGKSLFRIGCALLIPCAVLTVGISVWSLPSGLSGSYYDNPSWTGDPVHALRYFETPGRRVDRFIDFNPNDFNNRYPFSGKPFSVKWQGYVYVPDNTSQLRVTSNLGTWLYLDDHLVDGPHKINLGTPEARRYLREGWSNDELWGSEPRMNFVWSSGRRSELYLGVDEIADYTFLFRCMPFVYEGSPQQKLSIYINEVLLETVLLTEHWKTYAVSVPQAIIQDVAPGFFRVRFTYSNVVRPSEVMKPSNDGRQLAVAFDWAGIQKSSGNSGVHSDVTQKFSQPYSLSQGIHHITLKALQNTWVDPFIQLVRIPEKRNTIHVIPEDYLFPQFLSLDRIRQLFPQERVILGISIFYKCFLIILMGGTLGVYRVVPFFRKGSFLNREILFLLGIGILALGVRLAFILEMAKLDPAFHILPQKMDHLNYVFYARGFFRGYWPGLLHEPFYFGPLISCYFIVCSLLFGKSLTTIRIVTAAMATGSILLTFVIARKAFNTSVAYIAAALCACNGMLIFYDTSLLIAPLMTFLCLVVLWLTFKLKEQASWRITIALGVVLGITALARSNIFLLLPFLFFWIIMGCTGSFWQKIARFLVICVMMAVTIMPVTIRNYVSHYKHPFVLTTSGGGINLWIGNNPSANGMFGISTDLLEETRKRMQETGTSYLDEVIRYIIEQPRDYLALEYGKFKMFWRGYEIGNLIPYYIFRQGSKILKLPWINFVLVGPLGIVGMILTLKRWKTMFMLYSFVCIQMFTTLLFFALARYRIPVVPVLSIFAAYALRYIGQTFQGKHWRKFVAAAGLFCALYVMMNYAEAARKYQNYHGEPMPFRRVFRYWDLFHTP